MRFKYYYKKELLSGRERDIAKSFALFSLLAGIPIGIMIEIIIVLVVP